LIRGQGFFGGVIYKENQSLPKIWRQFLTHTSPVLQVVAPGLWQRFLSSTFMKKLLLAFTLLVAFVANAQKGDFITIRKKGQTFKTLFTGSMVHFRSVTGDWYNGRIVDIANDTIFFREVIVQQVPTPWGVSRLDTMTTFIRKIHYHDIAAIPRRETSFGYIKNGSLQMIGGAGYMGLNLINSGIQHYAPFGRENRGQLIAAAGVFAVGKLLHTLRKPFLLIGEKYTLTYVKG
jgi:hypothetical protein